MDRFELNRYITEELRKLKIQWERDKPFDQLVAKFRKELEDEREEKYKADDVNCAAFWHECYCDRCSSQSRRFGFIDKVIAESRAIEVLNRQVEAKMQNNNLVYFPGYKTT